MTGSLPWLAATLLFVGVVGCGAHGSREEAPTPYETERAASEDPRLPEGARRTLDLRELPGDCEVQATCGGLVGVDCDSAADGPYYYVEASSGRILEYCGGACMGGSSPDSPLCRNCPAIGWTCGH
ncbi:hypothetical protein [Pyxidicoccus xibeiensis]|uniref:hypothetical protein n=1 Tax=Pyxidicoccus xibeiensis TaxID=2906759 RepID=UPI0020A7CC4D|nr:hypothetical protein [Pyxidicoccus xibeiensis]MCP3139995.1 hypothetical protein [Pyxidicoccus xibeiensis]